MIFIDHLRQYLQDHPRRFLPGEIPRLLDEAEKIASQGLRPGVNQEMLTSTEVSKLLLPECAAELYCLIGTSDRYEEISVACFSKHVNP